MSIFDDVARAARKLAAPIFHPGTLLDNVLASVLHVAPRSDPKVVSNAVHLVACAHAGDMACKRKVHDLAARNPRMRELFAVISHALKSHPHYGAFRNAGPHVMHPHHVAPPAAPRGAFPTRPLPPHAHGHLTHSHETPTTSGWAYPSELAHASGQAADIEGYETGSAAAVESAETGYASEVEGTETGAARGGARRGRGGAHGGHGMHRGPLGQSWGPPWGGPFGPGPEYLFAEQRAAELEFPEPDEEPEPWTDNRRSV